MNTHVITHRGLNPDVSGFPPESSREAFTAFLSQGWGLEFDPQRTADGNLVVVHDGKLTRITGGKDERRVAEVSAAELLALDLGGGNGLMLLPELIRDIDEDQASDAVSALHVKAVMQTPENLDLLLKHLEEIDPKRLVLFDITVATARYIKERNPLLRLVPSVALAADIAQFGSVTGNTLLSIEEVLANRDLFDGVWLDEWGPNGQLYTAEVFAQLKAAGLWIGLVTPELHGTSPGLLGGEAHPDAATRELLMARIASILALSPDAVCTDHPDAVQKMIDSL